ncbi:MAG: flagellar M-ring protein FliF [Oscillospiraceae bacterium]|nr:flagellar M-ring protein FliF [Oscillospiraceae bacterium]
MKQKLSDIWQKLKTWWLGLENKTRILLIAAVAFILAVSLVTVLILNHREYVLFYNGASAHDSASVIAVLEEMGIEYNFSNTGAIFIPESDFARARLRLSQQGFVGDFGYDIFGQAGLTATQSDRNTYTLYQLQDRLAESIRLIPEVETAVVTINAPQPSIYALQSTAPAPSASIMVIPRQGRHFTAEQVRVMLNIVTPAVAGLEEENVSIGNNVMDLKMLLLEPAGNASTNKLNLTEEVNAAVRDRVTAMLLPAYGPDNFRVGVNTVLDTDARITQTETFHPIDEENPRDNPLQRGVWERERVGGNWDVIQGVVGANDNVDVPMYAAEDIPVEDADHFVARDILDYLVSSTREEIIKDGLTITDMSVAVLINSSNLPTETRDAMIDLVSKAAGVPRDKVSVQSVPFFGVEPMDLGADGFNFTIPLIITAIAFLMLLLIFLLVILHMRKRQREAAALAADEAAALEAARLAAARASEYAGGYEEEDDGYEPIVIPETAEMKLKNQIRDLAVSDPEIVANLLKTWLSQA